MHCFKEKIKFVITIIICCVMGISLPLQTYATTLSKTSTKTSNSKTADSDSLTQAQKDKDDLESSLKEAQDLISNLKDSKDDIETKIQQLDAKLTNISDKIQKLETDLNKKNTEITVTQKQLQTVQQQSNQQYENMKLRIKFMYENASSMSYLELLFSAKNVSGFLSSADYIHELSEYDRDMLQQYQTSQHTIEQKGIQLKKDYADLNTMQNQLATQQQAVEALKTEKNTQLASVGDEIDTATDTAQEYTDELQAQNEVIEEIKAQQAMIEAKKKADEEAKAAAKAAESAKNQTNSTTQSTENTKQEESEATTDTYSGGAFVWPSKASKTISSDYGIRTSPTSGASTNHKGIDIAAPYGSDILAAASGTVIYAGYSAAAGNHVIIDHGGGICTVYMHASSLNVSVGDTVSAGQSIAKVGSTGISTGNHLHFGVTVDGGYVSPWNYLQR